MPDPRAYLVRDEPEGARRHPDKVFPYNLRGLLAAIDEARWRSFGDIAQVVIVRRDGASWPIRRFERGEEVPVDGE